MSIHLFIIIIAKGKYCSITVFNLSLFTSANLSRDYFTDRQDRYIVFKNCKQLADFFADIVNTTLAHSYTLDQNGSTVKPSALPYDPLLSRKTAAAFQTSLSHAIKQLTIPCTEANTMDCSEFDTVVFPLFQMGFYGIKQDETVTQKLLSSVGKDDSLYLASGYFNLPPIYSQAILQGKGTYSVLAAAPQVYFYPL